MILVQSNLEKVLNPYYDFDQIQKRRLMAHENRSQSKRANIPDIFLK